jgi:hypothetical protein
MKMNDNDKKWFLEGVKAENDTWFPITDSPENYGYDREREIQVRGTAV